MEQMTISKTRVLLHSFGISMICRLSLLAFFCLSEKKTRAISPFASLLDPL